MKIAKWWGSILVLIVLCGLVVGKYWQKTSKTKIEKSYFGEEINKFCSSSFCLTKENNIWFLESEGKKLPANEELAETFSKRLKAIKLSEAVSDNKDRFVEMGFDDNKAEVTVGEKKLVLGNITSSLDGTLVKPDNEDKIYIVPVVLDKKNIGDKNYWEKKVLTNLPRLQITKITIKSGKKTVEMVPKDNKWENEKLVDKLAFLPVTKYMPDFKPNPKEIISEFEIEVEKEKTNLKIGRYWATVDNNYYFEIDKDDFSQLTGKR